MLLTSHWPVLKVETLEADTVLTDVLTGSELAFSGYSKIDFGNITIENFDMPMDANDEFGEYNGMYLAEKPLHMDGNRIVMNQTDSNHTERAISFDVADDTIILDQCRTTRIDTPIITMEKADPYNPTQISTSFMAQQYDDDWMWPGRKHKLSDGPQTEATRVSVVARASTWGMLGDIGGNNNLNVDRPSQSTVDGRNSAFEVLSTVQYIHDTTVHPTNFFGSYHVPIFQVAANPHLLTGANRDLHAYDNPNMSNTQRFQERPAATCINLPTRVCGNENPNNFPPGTGVAEDMNLVYQNKIYAEPDALAIRFGYTD